ncbi:conjugal transfer protein TraN [Klebsiella pneumoniae]|uniref:conjugal transfer protein TraN n=1 Tax=Klebsiella pneumoniae TaxID=573 RepID=UPI003D9965F4
MRHGGKRRWQKREKDKLTVSNREFCSLKKVLGICLEKKIYCQFDSKLAQIVQQQGRNLVQSCISVLAEPAV